MIISLDPVVSEPHESASVSFAAWRENVVGRGMLPVIGVTGSRGKSTVVRVLGAILAEAGLRAVLRTDLAVEIRGRPQRGEIAPWTRALRELDAGSLDVAVQEIDWLTLHTMGLESESHPVFAVTNICANKDACLIQGDAKRAVASLPTVFAGVSPDGLVVINGDDDELWRGQLGHERRTLVVGLKRETPGVKGQLARGGAAAWVENDQLTLSNGDGKRELGHASELTFALGGRAGFQVYNALLAASIAATIGVRTSAIAAALRQFGPVADPAPDSFQVIDLDGVSVVVDRPNPSWFLRPILRTLRDLSPSRIISVVGRLGGVPASDISEVARLIGRTSALVVAHSEEEEPTRSASVKQGIAQNDVPPLILHTKSEGRALTRALSIARPGDVVFVLADRPGPLVRTVLRAAGAPGHPAAAGLTAG
jgi:cyanophycin synthetase